MSAKGFLIEILLHTFLFTYITHKLQEHLVRTFTIS